MKASQPIAAASLAAFNALAGGGSLSAPKLVELLSAATTETTKEGDAILKLFGAPNLDPKSVEQTLDSWVGSKSGSAVFTRTNGIVNTYQLV